MMRETPLTQELVHWVDIVLVMEKAHRGKLRERFKSDLKHARVIV